MIRVVFQNSVGFERGRDLPAVPSVGDFVDCGMFSGTVEKVKWKLRGDTPLVVVMLADV